MNAIAWDQVLSAAQLDAATRLDVPVCILAGAGSGKTRAITHRMAYLMLEHRVAPQRILAVTFTNKAAGEMKQRVLSLVGAQAQRTQVGTFHGLAARILRRWGRAVNVLPSFVIYDADDWHRMLGRICVTDLNLTKDHAKGIGYLIESWQSEGLAPDAVPKGHEMLFDWALSAYTISRKRLDDIGALDFGGLLLKWRDLLNSEAGPFVKAEVEHLLVDEYQDVNAVQAEIVLSYANKAKTVAVVGDDDQAIYGWRGASADNLKKFLDQVPGARMVKLEENYRSTQTILEAANGIIAHNTVRLGKTLKATGSRGRAVRVIRARDDLQEASRIVSDIAEHVRAHKSLDDVAILYRTNALSRVFEDELRRHGFPYRVVGGMRFYDRKEVKDVIATLRCALNPLSDVDTLRFLMAVPRGIGDSTQKKVEAAARRAGTSILNGLASDAILDDADLNKGVRTRCIGVAGAVFALGQKVTRAAGAQSGLFEAPTLTAKDAVALAIACSGVAERLEAEASVEAEGRLENLHELLNAAAAFQERAQQEGEAHDVQGFLESAALLSSADDKNDGTEKLTLMTLHAAKGLEMDVVYLCGLEEHGFPHSRALQDGALDELEEERRLAYVGITRARERLVLSHADWRMVQGQKKRRTPSRFLSEIPREVLQGDLPPVRFSPFAFERPLTLARPRYDDVLADTRGHNSRMDAAGDARIEYDDVPSRRLIMTDAEFVPDGEVNARFVRRSFAREGAPPADTAHATVDAAADHHGLTAGTRVWHKHFGVGVVVGLRGIGAMASALVRFDEERQPRVIVIKHLQHNPGAV